MDSVLGKVWCCGALQSQFGSSQLTYLREAIKDSKVTPLFHRATSSSTQYDDLVKMLIERYDPSHFHSYK